jgi:hypothetical protein
MEGQQHTDFSVLPGIPPPSVTIRVWLSAVDGPPKGYIPVPIKADGSFTIADIAPGIYDVNMSGIFGLWMKSIRMGSVEAVDGRIEITNANGTAPLEITLSRSVSQIAGLVTGAGGSPAAFSTVVVLMEPPRSGGMSATTGTDKNGRFSATNLRPGSYRVYAFEDIAEAQRYDLDILKAAEANSLKVTLKENESAEVTLRQIPAAPIK